MNKTRDTEVDRLVKALDNDIESVDEDTLARLASARNTALNNALSKKAPLAVPSSFWVPGLSFASFVIIALVYMAQPRVQPPHDAFLTANDFEWLINIDDSNLIQEDFAFYDWVEAELKVSGSES